MRDLLVVVTCGHSKGGTASGSNSHLGGGGRERRDGERGDGGAGDNGCTRDECHCEVDERRLGELRVVDVVWKFDDEVGGEVSRV